MTKGAREELLLLLQRCVRCVIMFLKKLIVFLKVNVQCGIMSYTEVISYGVQ